MLGRTSLKIAINFPTIQQKLKQNLRNLNLEHYSLEYLCNGKMKTTTTMIGYVKLSNRKEI